MIHNSMVTGNNTGVENPIIAKLVKMRDLSQNAGTKEEAQTAMAILNRLLLKHKLELSDLETIKLETEEPVDVQYVYAGEYGFEVKHKRSKWLEELAEACAEHNFCDTMVMTGSNTQIFVGRKSDREVAIRMFTYLAAVAKELAIEAGRKYEEEFIKTYDWSPDKGQTRAFHDSFLKGFAHEVDLRLRQERQQLMEEEKLREEQEIKAMREAEIERRLLEDGMQSRIDEIIEQKLESVFAERQVSDSELSGLINELHEKAVEEITANVTSEVNDEKFELPKNAIMVIKKAEDAVRDYMDKGKRTGSIRTIRASGYRTNHNSAGYQRGRTAGSGVSLNGRVLR